MKENYKNKEKIYDAEVLESSTFDENTVSYTHLTLPTSHCV